MRLFEKSVGFLRLSRVFLILCLELLTFKLSLVVIKSLITLLTINKLIVKILKPAQVSDNATLVLLIVRLLEVAADLEHFEVVAEPVQVLDRLFDRVDLIVTDGKNVEFLERVELLELLNAVLEEREILEIDERFNALDLLDQVEAEVEPLELDEGLEALDASDDVVVELEFDKRLDANEIVDFDNVYIRLNRISYIKSVCVENSTTTTSLDLLLKLRER